MLDLILADGASAGDLVASTRAGEREAIAMKIKETKTYSMMFSQEEAKLIDSLIREQVGHRTIGSILDEFDFVIGYYSNLLTMVRKAYHGNYATLESGEINVLTNILSTAYNDGKHENVKDSIKELCDTIDLLKR